ncbi:hypothetical protein DL93DRAFT_2093982 [Clavulina sp. PMI_390]|nr:hypothetical protein DL93DRAFT_2093982 [Clavulina sp. PMI_390]
MAPAAATAPPVVRRLSYVIPAPSEPRTRLVLPSLDTPRRGRTTPLIAPYVAPSDPTSPLSPLSFRTARSSPDSPTRIVSPKTTSQNAANRPGASTSAPTPTHRLGVSAMAIDLSTHIAGKSSPEGILYTAGRDGLLISWELNAPTKPRRRPRPERGGNSGHRIRRGDWKVITGWDDDDQELSDEELEDAGDADAVLDIGAGDAGASSSVDASLPYEQRWQIDNDRTDDSTQTSSFRQSVQSHNDWINDILLCNMNQNVISASNDGTVKSWSPHHPTLANSPAILGKHSDYVKCLAHSPTQSWVASGSFDRTIKLWDINRSSSSTSANASAQTAPITTLTLGEASQKSSVYALAVDETGNLLASGSPERVVRLWDPRAGKKVGKLVGHTDNIRSVLVSADGRYVLTGSSDASIKIWSVSGQRCLHTFAHHSDSVWALHSSHPALSIFYSGDRTGLVCKVDMEDCADVSEGECVVVCRDTPDAIGTGGSNGGAARSRGKEGINALLALDDWAVWTATGASDIKRWRDPGRRADRMNSEASIQPWDHHTSTPGSAPDTFGFARLPSSMSLSVVSQSRSSTPVQLASSMMLRSGSTQSRADSTNALLFPPSPSPSAQSPLLANAANDGPSRPSSTPLSVASTSSFTAATNSTTAGTTNPRQSMQSFVSTVSFADETTSIDSPAYLTTSPIAGPGQEEGTANQTLFGLPFTSLVSLASPDRSYSYGPSTGGAGGGLGTRDPEVATLYSAASVMSVPTQAHLRPPVQSPTQHWQASPPPPSAGPAAASPLSVALMRSSSTNSAIPMINPASSFRQLPTSPNQLEVPNAAQAQMEFESRELAIDATPLRTHPVEVLRGSYGLVRSVILNDRIHALTVDTAGEVAVWDLMRCVCEGFWVAEDVERACIGDSLSSSSNSSHQPGGVEWSPRESLETVRERIEGEAMIASWANVETKMGSLTVHLAESTVFDAEVYADEAGFGLEDMSVFPEEHRINIGRWVLYNLFSGFVHVESLSLPGPQVTSSVEPKGILRQPAPQHISLGHRRLRSNSDLTVMGGPKTPGGGIFPTAVSTPNMAPAMPPELPSTLDSSIAPRSILSPTDSSGVKSPGGAHTRIGGGGLSLNLPKLPPIPASPGPLTSNIGSPTPKGAATPGASSHSKPLMTPMDYFSPRTPKTENGDTHAGEAPDVPATTPGPVTPGGRFMGRLKNLGKSTATTGKKPLTADDVASPAPISEEVEEVVEESPTVRAAKLNFAFLDSLQTATNPPATAVAPSTASTPPVPPTPSAGATPATTAAAAAPPPTVQIPTPIEAPRLVLPPGVSITITEQVPGENSWTTVYDGAAADTKDDMQLLEATAPLWVLECLFANKISQQSLVKVSFMVTPWNKGDGEMMPELLNSQARLNASRALRVRKVALYVRSLLHIPAITVANNTWIRISQGQARKSISSAAPSATPSRAPTPAPATTSTTASPSASTTATLAAPGAAGAVTSTSPPASEPMRSLPSSSPQTTEQHRHAANEFEILCNDTVLPFNMTLAAVRHYVWRQSGELAMQYRKKAVVAELSKLSDEPMVDNVSSSLLALRMVAHSFAVLDCSIDDFKTINALASAQLDEESADEQLRPSPIKSRQETTSLYATSFSGLLSRRAATGTRSFHTSPRSLADRRYTRFGGETSSGGGGILGNVGARFSDPSTRMLILVVVGLGERMSFSYWVSLILGGYYVYHLERVPESGRWRFIDVSKAAEREAGLETFKQIMQEHGSNVLPQSHKLSRFVQSIAERIISSSNLGHVKGYETFAPPAASFSDSPYHFPGVQMETAGGGDLFDPDSNKGGVFGASRNDDAASITDNEEWEVFVIHDDKTRNAFVLPGGKIFVFTGILPVAKTEDGLASVIGHVARHSGERMSGSKVIFALMILLDILGLDFGTGINRLGLSLLLTLPNSRTQESEADAIGLRLMSKACFDPREAAQMWVRMEHAEHEEDKESSGGIGAWFCALILGGSVGNVDFLSTHPASGKRIKAMEERLPEALALRAASPGCASQLSGEFEAFKRFSG